ncbi:hypothetical protein [Actinomadura livida]|uniref:Heme/copper-type cytochrome/quinol oxidase subunit 2 n=1 Tax=Actinomadura livida TaxID=79909 RepID=A0A7W7IH52_9ACTN|nr:MULTISPECIES: hypothetical protein [Actinomadura]MBB4777009.1 heme/copper-type cytochrome/quinol oxidase subunit 2 [Actinomadura catellatispora]GGT96353.1 hypothetical protein GCM10010208_19800 [Actinomadura livida]
MRTRWTEAQKEATEKDVLPSWHATRKRRRVLAGAGGAAIAMVWSGTVVSWNLAPSDTAMYWTISLLVLAVLIALPVITVLNAATRGTVSLAERDLDERQVAERLRAHAVAHRAMLVLLAVVVVAVLGVPGDRGTFIPMAAIVMGVVSLFLTHLLMPVLVAGWRQPDPPPDDEETA